MTHDNLTDFESQICRAVASMGASSRRKRVVREEMLAHLSEVFEQELVRQPDAQMAAEATKQRFGDASDLREQLQASVPVFEAIIFTFLAAKENHM